MHALPYGPGLRSSSAERDTELASADFQVADARARLERWTGQVEDNLRRGSPAYSRELLASCEEILREMIARRDAAAVKFSAAEAAHFAAD